MYGELEAVRICRMIERDLQETRLRRMARLGRFAMPTRRGTRST